MPSIYEKYNLKQVINTSGRMTALGVSTPRPEVVQAAMDGMNHYFEMKDLVNKTGEYIAKLLDVEGATVVSCASAGIAQSVAAVLVKDSDWLLENLHVTPVENNEIVVTRPSDAKEDRSLHGLTRTLIHNMVEGVTTGFKKELEINGVGYRASKEGKNLVMILGYSHKVIMPEIEGISIEVPGPNKIIVTGPDKQVVGQFAANIREKRKPEPYKGKGIKYIDEVIIRKEGKAGKGK